MKINNEYLTAYSDEIAEAIYTLIRDDVSGDENEIKEQLKNAVYDLELTAKNPYNSEFFRTIYKALQVIAINTLNI